MCAGDIPEQRDTFMTLLDQLRAELAPSSLLESLIVERIAAALWRSRRVLAFESGTALERDSVPAPDMCGCCGTSRPAVRPIPRALSAAVRWRGRSRPQTAIDLAIRYEAHLTREVGRLLMQLEHARRLSAVADPEHRA